ncbi:UNVERIFIED_CONTAM: hypothetical protein PYX00_001623 [Menopon gallinae]|uniref:SH3 domain-containing protein n=1 Tax=Menopon gallinae TaxID=328185 RepID=A0AAW2IEW6_9NEOP
METQNKQERFVALSRMRVQLTETVRNVLDFFARCELCDPSVVEAKYAKLSQLEMAAIELYMVVLSSGPTVEERNYYARHHWNTLNTIDEIRSRYKKWKSRKGKSQADAAKTLTEAKKLYDGILDAVIKAKQGHEAACRARKLAEKSSWVSWEGLQEFSARVEEWKEKCDRAQLEKSRAEKLARALLGMGEVQLQQFEAHLNAGEKKLGESNGNQSKWKSNGNLSKWKSNGNLSKWKSNGTLSKWKSEGNLKAAIGSTAPKESFPSKDTTTDSQSETIIVRALSDFRGQGPDKISFKEGDVFVKFKGTYDKGWSLGRNNDTVGLFPDRLAKPIFT